MNLPHSAQLDGLARAAGELYTRTVVTYWRLVRTKQVFLSQYKMERIHISPELHAHTSDAVVGDFYASVKSGSVSVSATEAGSNPPNQVTQAVSLSWVK